MAGVLILGKWSAQKKYCENFGGVLAELVGGGGSPFRRGVNSLRVMGIPHPKPLPVGGPTEGDCDSLKLVSSGTVRN